MRIDDVSYPRLGYFSRILGTLRLVFDCERLLTKLQSRFNIVPRDNGLGVYSSHSMIGPC